MVKKRRDSEQALPVVEKWDPDSKEPWLINLEKEPVNDERWTCLVTAAIPAEVQDEECLRIYRRCVATGLRKAIKIITMADIIQLLRGEQIPSPQPPVKENKKGKHKPEAPKPKEPEDTILQFVRKEAPIVELARKYAVFTEVECELPPFVMASLLKYIILALKHEDIRQKKISIAKQKRLREHLIKMKFLEEVMQQEIMTETSLSDFPTYGTPSNFLDVFEPINDEPLGGPDLYIMLIDFFNPLYFSELQNMLVPLLALLQINGSHDLFGRPSSTSRQVESRTKNAVSFKKSSLISTFWNILKTNFAHLEDSNFLKNTLLIEFQMRSLKYTDNKIVFNLMFDELSWLQYSAYTIFRQHQNYLKEMVVHRMVLTLEPLDLSRCDLYNKLCDNLITGEPSTPMLVLFAIIEQVAAGVPHFESVSKEYEKTVSDILLVEDFVHSHFESYPHTTKSKKVLLMTPCEQCRHKLAERVSSEVSDKDKHKQEDTVLFNITRSDSTPKKSTALSSYVGEASFKSLFSTRSKIKSKSSNLKKYEALDHVICTIISEGKFGKEPQSDKKWQTPVLNLYGDFISLDAFHCDKRLVDPQMFFERFLKNTDVTHLWNKYPELSSSKNAYYNYQFKTLWKKTPDSVEFLKLKIFLALIIKLFGITKSDLFQGDEETVSEAFGSLLREKSKKKSFRYDQSTFSVLLKSENDCNLSHCTFTKVTTDKNFLDTRRTTFKIESFEHLARSIVRNTDFGRNALNNINLILSRQQSTGAAPSTATDSRSKFSDLRPQSSQMNTESQKLFNILDCIEISNLTDYYFLGNEDSAFKYIDELKYFESLEPLRMVQRLVEAHENYNAIQCLYFPPTDSLMIIMQNDFDHRGLYFAFKHGKLVTPVTLRDFYKFVYSEIKDWIADEEAEYNNLMVSIIKKENDLDNKRDELYRLSLTKEYQSLNEEEKAQFLQKLQQPLDDRQTFDFHVEDLPKKQKPVLPVKTTFFGINLSDVQVECYRNIQQFFSDDGTEINISVDTWAYKTNKLMGLSIKKSSLKLLYYHWIGGEKINRNFIFRTLSDIIFSFYKPEIEELVEEKDEEEIFEEKEDEDPSLNYEERPFFNYYLQISWPTGLLIQPKPHKSLGPYIRQSYIKVYRKKWDIREEKSRCYLRNGQILIFKENGTVDIFHGSGTIISLSNFKKKNSEYIPSNVYDFEVINSSGEKWEKNSKVPHRRKKRHTNTYKIYIGVDEVTLEIYYRREDGVNFMLWPSGKLITCFPDGTKITSIPEFEEKIVYVDSEEEKTISSEKTIKLKASPAMKKSDKNMFISPDISKEEIDQEGFVSVYISYLLEHPKYASVSYNTNEDLAYIKIPDDLNIRVDSQGNYEVKQNNHVLNVTQTLVEFYTECRRCHESSHANLVFDNEHNMCKFVDFFRKEILISRNGELNYKEENREDISMKSKTFGKDMCGHSENIISNQRCFAFERDLSGWEIVHSDHLSKYFYPLPKDTYYDLDSPHPKDPLFGHTFCVPYSKVGYENWTMEYENLNDTLPTTLKKKDLKEEGKKEVVNKLYKVPFPKNQEWEPCGNRQTMSKTEIPMPKVIVSRTVKFIPDKPMSILKGLQVHVDNYRETVRSLYEKYVSSKKNEYETEDQSIITKKLKQISMALNVTPFTHPELSCKLPAIEKEMHSFAHSIKFNELLKLHFQNEMVSVPYCKYISRTLPRNSFFQSLPEENEKEVQSLNK